MKILLDYSEVQLFVHDHYSKEITLQYVDARTIRIGASMSFTPSNDERSILQRIKSLFKKAVSQVVNVVTIDLIVEQVKDNSITIRRSSGIGTELLMNGVMNYLKKTKPLYGNVVEEQSGGVLTVYLDGIYDMNKICELVSIDDISFEPDNVVVVAKLKNTNRGI